MILLVTLPLSLISLIIFWLRNVRIYKQNFGRSRLGGLSIIDSYNTLFSAPNMRLLDVPHKNFFNYTANLITKFIHFIIFSVTSHLCAINDIYFVGTILIVVYVLFTAWSWRMYRYRSAYFNAIPSEQQEFFSPLLKACICIPIYQTLILILLVIT